MTAEEIRARREGAGMTPADLAAQLGVSVRTLARLEAGQKDPTRAEIIALDVIFSEQVGAKSPRRTTRKSNGR
jgi:DNA-binding transcriptional regulator YiaG